MPDAGDVTMAPLHAAWQAGMAVVNLRGNPQDTAFVHAVADALGVAFPVAACSAVVKGTREIIWAGPDDWFVLDSATTPAELFALLRDAVAGLHAAVTDVSSGYMLLRLAGAPVREVLSQGCPLDLHRRIFTTGQCAGSHFFKASVWLWQTGDAPQFSMLVRRSFSNYVQLMLEKATQECGLVMQTADRKERP